MLATWEPWFRFATYLSKLHRELKARAALEGMSLSEYLLREIRRILERPRLEDLQRRLAGRRRINGAAFRIRAARSGISSP